jgi:phosphocarrier protein HPr
MAVSSLHSPEQGARRFVESETKQSQVVVAWTAGLHLRPAARLVRVAQKFRSSVTLVFKGRVADVRSILSVVALCATMGAALEIEVSGDDEENALAAVEQVFSSSEDTNSEAKD